MSSTNRGGKRSEADWYSTPPWCTHRLLEKCDLPGGIWYEPCAGEGAIIQAVKLSLVQPGGCDAGMSHTPVKWYANELREDAEPLLKKWVSPELTTFGDYLDEALKTPPSEEVRVVITNPPFRIAYEVLQRSLAGFPNAHVALLLRLNFWGSVKRRRFLATFPADTYVMPNRPDFIGHGKTDSPEYAWFVWPPSPRRREAGIIKVLGETSLEERRKSNQTIVYPVEA